MGTIASMIGGAILAAGRGSRIGQPKALLPMAGGGSTFVERAVRTLQSAAVSPIVVVVSPEFSQAVRGLAPGAAVHVNPEPDRGQLSSLVVALDALAPESPDAVVVLPVDVPLVTSDTVAALIDVWRRYRPPIVRPTRGTAHGHPVIFDARLFDELRGADPAIGAKGIVRKYASAEGDVATEDEGAFLDIDTPEDYRKAFGDSNGAPGTPRA